MKLTEELQFLAKLHKEGSLTDSEFALAKQKLLSERVVPEAFFPARANRPDSDLANAARTYITWQVISTIIGGIVFLFFLVNFFLPRLAATSQPTIRLVTPSK
jgi:hypothetical protein